MLSSVNMSFSLQDDSREENGSKPVSEWELPQSQETGN
jgi:hypothetical protein